MTTASEEEANAFKLLRALKINNNNDSSPILVTELRAETGLNENDLKNAWRYLRNKQLIEVFAIPYTARINDKGTNSLGARGANTANDSTSDPSRGSGLFGLTSKWIAGLTALLVAIGALIAAFTTVCSNAGFCQKEETHPIGPVTSKAVTLGLSKTGTTNIYDGRLLSVFHTKNICVGSKADQCPWQYDTFVRCGEYDVYNEEDVGRHVCGTRAGYDVIASEGKGSCSFELIVVDCEYFSR